MQAPFLGGYGQAFTLSQTEFSGIDNNGAYSAFGLSQVRDMRAASISVTEIVHGFFQNPSAPWQQMLPDRRVGNLHRPVDGAFPQTNRLVR
jgi:hypothetical protein